MKIDKLHSFRKFKIVAETIEKYAGNKIISPEEADNYLRPLFADQIDVVEMFFVVFLDNQKNVIGHYHVSTGGRFATYVDTSIIYKTAVETLANSVILAHNHPTGTFKASAADLKLTSKIAAGLKTLQIEIDDHLILMPDAKEKPHLSFRCQHNDALNGYL